MIVNAKKQELKQDDKAYGLYRDLEMPTNQPERPEDFDYRNLSDFFRLLLKVDQRINPQKYIIKQTNQNQND